jgi:hypothetical protein
MNRLYSNSLRAAALCRKVRDKRLKMLSQGRYLMRTSKIGLHEYICREKNSSLVRVICSCMHLGTQPRSAKSAPSRTTRSCLARARQCRYERTSKHGQVQRGRRCNSKRLWAVNVDQLQACRDQASLIWPGSNQGTFWSIVQDYAVAFLKSLLRLLARTCTFRRTATPCKL